MSSKYTWEEDIYDTIESISIGITNYIVSDNPLLFVNGQWYTRYRNRLLHAGEDIKRKLSETKSMNLERLNSRLYQVFRQSRSNSDDNTQDL